MTVNLDIWHAGSPRSAIGLIRRSTDRTDSNTMQDIFWLGYVCKIAHGLFCELVYCY